MKKDEKILEDVKWLILHSAEWWRWPPFYNYPISLMKFSKGSQNSHSVVFSRQLQTS